MANSRASIIVLLFVVGSSQLLAITSSDTLHYSVFMGSRSAGHHLSWVDNDGNQMYYFTFNDRGRGPSLTERVIINDSGKLQSISVTGHDYTKNQVDEQFVVHNDKAKWSSVSDNGSSNYSGQYYYAINSTIAGKEILLQMLAKSGKEEIGILPFGKIKISIREEVEINNHQLTLYGISGVSYEPSFYWMDESQKLFAVVSPSRGITCIRKEFENLKQDLVGFQVKIEDEYYRLLAESLSEKPMSKTIITNVSIFNSEEGVVEKNKSLIYEGNKIIAIIDIPDPVVSADMFLIDGTGMTLMPGFFDMHVHIGKNAGLLHIAGGVTSVRDMAVQVNYIKDKQKLANNFKDNLMIGPRIVRLSGFIDGSGPFTRDMGIDRLEQGLEWIDEFNEAGIRQIKLYSSIKPEWVKPLADRAHQYGMVVSGHIPAFMTATQAIKHGFNEIQHTNMLFLNFYGDSLDTRNMTRFSAVGERGHSLDFKSLEFNRFVQLLINNNIVIDPTLAIFEWGFKSVSGEPSPTYKEIVHRLPLSHRRQYYTGGFARPPGIHQKYLDSYDRMMDMVYELYSRGVRVVPGTDNLAGFAYHRELELYVKSGIPANEVLQLATIRSAETIGRSHDLGSLKPGKLADMVLIKGNPLENISAIRNTVLTIKDGVMYKPDKLYKAVGILPR